MLPLVSVIIPAYNAASFIRQTLGSVLSQSYQNLEVIVVDDGSQDQTASIVKSIAESDDRVTLLHQSNRGVAAARNLAIAKSGGEYIAPIDADDLWHSRKIEKQMQCILQAGPTVGFVYVWSVVIDQEGLVVDVSPQWDVEGVIYRALICRHFLSNASVPLIRRTCLDHVGGYSNHLERGGQGCEDWDLVLRIAEQYAVRVVPDYLVAYRLSTRSMSRNCNYMAKSYELIIEDIEQRHPEIPTEIYRWSRSAFYHYLTRVSYGSRNWRDALRWAYKGLTQDPALILSLQLQRTIVRSLLEAFGDSIIFRRRHRVRPDLQRRSRKPSAALCELSEGYSSRGFEVRSTPWQRWSLYDRICARRWKAAKWKAAQWKAAKWSAAAQH